MVGPLSSRSRDREDALPLAFSAMIARHCPTAIRCSPCGFGGAPAEFLALRDRSGLPLHFSDAEAPRVREAVAKGGRTIHGRRAPAPRRDVPLRVRWTPGGQITRMLQRLAVTLVAPDSVPCGQLLGVMPRM
jgi:hypothetical protein